MNQVFQKPKNPFTPSFGSLPEVMAGRSSVLSSFERAFKDGTGNPYLSTIFVGARGTGKTALLTSVAHVAQSQGWICAPVSALEGMLDDILQCTLRGSKHLATSPAKSKLSSVEIGQIIGFSWDNPPQDQQNWRGKMTDALEDLAQTDTGLLITVDEVRPDLPEMKQLVSVYQHFVREGRKVSLCMAGLPFRISALLSDEDVSYLRRARRCTLERLTDAEVSTALRRTIALAGGAIDNEGLKHATSAVGGFPYMLQLVGWWTWESAADVSNMGISDAAYGVRYARGDLQQGILDVTWNEMSPVDKKFAAALASEGSEATLATIAERMGVKSNYATKYKKRLMEQGIIGEHGKNTLRFEIPGSASYFAERYTEEEN